MVKKFLITSLVAIIVLVILMAKTSFSAGTKSEALPTPTPYVPIAVYLNSDKVWQLVQNWRASQGFKHYVKDERLCNIAKDRANDMFIIDQTDGHTGFRQKYSNMGYVVSENIVGALNEQEALDKWLVSPSHLAALKANWKYSCLECKGMYCSQIFSNF